MRKKYARVKRSPIMPTGNRNLPSTRTLSNGDRQRLEMNRLIVAKVRYLPKSSFRS